MNQSKDPLIHFPFYCHQYMGLLSKYTYEEQGAFLRVLCGYITEDGQICKESKHRIFAAFTNSEKKAVNTVYEHAISLAETIIKEQKQKREINRENGKKGGRPPNPLVKFG